MQNRILHCLCGLVLTVPWLSAQDSKPKAQPTTEFPVLSDTETWARLLQDKPTLPLWARTLAGPQPTMTASLLELNALHRSQNPLGASIAAYTRYVVADELNAEYFKHSCEADVRRSAKLLVSVKVDQSLLSADPVDASRIEGLIRQLTKNASLVTDTDFAKVLKILGPEKMTALVHTVAFANFEARLSIGLGLQTAETEDIPPLGYKIDPAMLRRGQAAKRTDWQQILTQDTVPQLTMPDWSDTGTEQLSKNLESQKQREARIQLPDLSFAQKLPPEAKTQAEKIVWMRISMGYQPALTAGWFKLLEAYRADASMDRVFSNSLFWVVTRTNDCFY